MEICKLINVLVIDDDPEMTDLLSLLLKPRGFNVNSCNSGEEGVNKARVESPEIIILDLMMKGMDGWQVCSAVRKFSNVPILILSALNHPGTVVRALDAGADDFLTKPVSSGLLVSRLRTLMRRTHPSESAVLLPATNISTQ
jgi:two-component system KDP operon response regulator KdpE